MTQDTLTLTKPDDWHCIYEMVRRYAHRCLIRRCFGRAIVMPNLKPPVTSVSQALAYRERIMVRASGGFFRPLMTLYLTDNLPADELNRLADEPDVAAVKYYPAGATTNSDSGVTSIEKVASARKNDRSRNSTASTR